MIDLSFASGEDSLSVRRFSVREAISTLFEVEIEARSPTDQLDFDAIVGSGAALRLGAEDGARLYRGVCSGMEQTEVESSGLSTYAIRIVPSLWLLTQRRNHRLFQHLSVIEIVRAILGEWNIHAAFEVDEARHPRLELRVQYGESDFDFVSRLLEDAGIAFVFPNDEKAAPLLLTDDVYRAATDSELPPIAHVGDAGATRHQPHVTEVRLAHAVRPGRFTIRDTDFRRQPDYQLLGTATSGSSEDRYEQYHYAPGSFLVEAAAGVATKGGDGAARHDEKEGQQQAARSLERSRSSRRVVSFRTNVAVWPGAIVSIAGHPRPDLGDKQRLLVTEITTDGVIGGDLRREVRAGFIGPAEPWLPPRRAPRPRIQGVQTAVVVGPKGEEIHTDDLGRVRVQFPWDREGRFDERSSCWIRVSHGWAGGAFGMIALPRVGQEVLVEFMEGDPNLPIIVGRVYNTTSAVPYKLPEHQTISTWKSASSPGGEGSNEIMFEDAKGGERLYVQAERDLERLVKRDATTNVGNDRRMTVAHDDTTAVGGERWAEIANGDVISVGTRHAVTVASAAGVPTASEMIDGRITFTTGGASLTLEGPNIILDAAAGILMKAATDISLVANANITANADVALTLGAGSTLIVRSERGDVVLQGGPYVHINPETTQGALVAAGLDAPPELPPGVDLEADIATAEEHARFNPRAPAWFNEQVKPGGAWDYGRLGPQYAAFASFHYGLVGRAMGFPEGALLHQNGLRKSQGGAPAGASGDPGNGLWGGTYPYGADPRDQEMTRKGFAYHARRYG